MGSPNGLKGRQTRTWMSGGDDKPPSTKDYESSGEGQASVDRALERDRKKSQVQAQKETTYPRMFDYSEQYAKRAERGKAQALSTRSKKNKGKK